MPQPQHRYVAIADDLRARIGKGEFRPGDRLPPEKELANQYGVAAMTIRSALRVLIDEGLVKSLHGVGSFVTQPQTASVEDQIAELRTRLEALEAHVYGREDRE